MTRKATIALILSLSALILAACSCSGDGTEQETTEATTGETASEEETAPAETGTETETETPAWEPGRSETVSLSEEEIQNIEADIEARYETMTPVSPEELGRIYPTVKSGDPEPMTAFEAANVPAEAETPDTDDDSEKAEAIRLDILERKGIDIGGSTLAAIPEILLESGYRDVDPYWLYGTLRGKTDYGSPEALMHGREAETTTVQPNAKSPYESIENLTVPDDVTWTAWEHPSLPEWEELPDYMMHPDTSNGAHYCFFTSTIQYVYKTYGEINYYDYYDEATDTIYLSIYYGSDRSATLENLIDDAVYGTNGAAKAWDDITDELTTLSGYAKRILDEAGFRSATVEVSLRNSIDAIVFEAFDGRADYDIVEDQRRQIQELRKK